MYLFHHIITEFNKEKETKNIFDFEFACINVNFFRLDNINF